MVVLQEINNGFVILSPSPGIDSSTAKQFEDVLLAAVAARRGDVILDLGELDYISSAGLRSILIGAKAAKAVSCRMVLCALRPHIRKVFDTSGFSKLVAIVPDRDEALRAA